MLCGDAVLEQLDEHATSLFAWLAMIEMNEILRDKITIDELIPAASHIMSYLVKIEEERCKSSLVLVVWR